MVTLPAVALLLVAPPLADDREEAEARHALDRLRSEGGYAMMPTAADQCEWSAAAGMVESLRRKDARAGFGTRDERKAAQYTAATCARCARASVRLPALKKVERAGESGSPCAAPSCDSKSSAVDLRLSTAPLSVAVVSGSIVVDVSSALRVKLGGSRQPHGLTNRSK